MSIPYIPVRQSIVNGSGRPYAAAVAYFYAAGTSTPRAVYAESSLDTSLGASVTASAAGKFVPIYLDPSANYRVIVKDGAGNTLSDDDDIQSSYDTAWCGTASGADTIVLTPSTPLGAYATGQTFRFKSAGANTGAATVNISTLGAIALKKNGTTALAAGDIPGGAIVEITYDGTNFQITSAALAAIPTLTGNNTLSGNNTISGTTTHSGALNATGITTLTNAIAKAFRLTQADVASGTNVTFVATAAFWRITGTTTINTITTPTTGGTLIVLLFTDSVTVNDDGTSSGNLVLAGGANLSATANDVLVLIWNSTDSKWLEVCRSVN